MTVFVCWSDLLFESRYLTSLSPNLDSSRWMSRSESRMCLWRTSCSRRTNSIKTSWSRVICTESRRRTVGSLPEDSRWMISVVATPSRPLPATVSWRTVSERLVRPSWTLSRLSPMRTHHLIPASFALQESTWGRRIRKMSRMKFTGRSRKPCRILTATERVRAWASWNRWGSVSSKTKKRIAGTSRRRWWVWLQAKCPLRIPTMRPTTRWTHWWQRFIPRCPSISECRNLRWKMCQWSTRISTCLLWETHRWTPHSMALVWVL